MAELEKVIKAFEICSDTSGSCYDCPYFLEDGIEPEDCNQKAFVDALNLLKEIKPYGGFIEFPDVVGNLIGYTTIVEKMLKAGILKVEKQEAPMLTRYNWAIKAVKWDDKD